MAITEADVQTRLRALIDPNTGKDFVTGKAVKKIQIGAGDIVVDIQLGYPAKTQHEILRKLIAQDIAALPGRAARHRQHDAEDHVALGPARREADPGRQEHHRGRVRQGRRRQVDDGGQPRAGARRRRAPTSACSTPTSTARRSR